jgi:hypothetical protein
LDKSLRTGVIWTWRKYKKETNVDVVILNEKQLGETGVGTRNFSKIEHLPQ